MALVDFRPVVRVGRRAGRVHGERRDAKRTRGGEESV
jgi:hypothetical protein